MKNIFVFGFGYTANMIIHQLQQMHTINIACTTTTESKLHILQSQNYNAHLLHSNYNTISANMIQDLANADLIIISIPTTSSNTNLAISLLEECQIKLKKSVYLVYLSSTAVYGDHQGQFVNEASKLLATSKRGIARIEAEKLFLNFVTKNSYSFNIFRIAGIYGPFRSQFNAVKNGLKKIIYKENHYFSRIHVYDLSSLIIHSILNKNCHNQIFNIADNLPEKPEIVTHYLYSLLQKTPPKSITIDNPNISEMTKSFYADNKKIDASKIKKLTNYQLLFPTYKEGYQHAFSKEQS